MKTDKKSRVPLFTFPPPLLAALFLLAGCHYKALQGTVGATGDWAWSEVTQPHVPNTHARTHLSTPRTPSLTHTRTHAQARADTRVHICTHVNEGDPATPT